MSRSQRKPPFFLKRMAANQKGVGLIEVLVTVLILATSLLAMAALQSRSLQFNHGAYLRSQANIMAYDIIDRMRINAVVNINDYARDYADSKPTGSSLADTDLNDWLTNIEGTLPGGEGAIDCDANRVCTVRLRWIEEDRAPGDDEGEQGTVEFVYSTKLEEV